ncbi:MAG: energy transducer TonB [Polyangiales bacterium]
MTSPLENLPPWALETAWVVLAIVAHAGLIAAMPPIPRGDGGIDESVVVSIVDENFVTEPDEEEEPEPVEEAELPEPEPVKPPPRPKTFKAPTDPPKELLEEPPAAAPETPVAFDNIVLTNEGDEPASWAVDPGSGESREGPIGRPDAVVTGRSREGVVGGVIGGTGIGVVVDVGDLSRQPIPPALKAKLEKLYPKKARQEGVEGTADARLYIGPDGLPAKIRILSEDPPGYEFGEACKKALKGEVWKPPIDKEGKPVTTRVTFRCGFEIRY